MNDLLGRKLHRPVLRSHLIHRQQLLTRLHGGLSARLILVCAPTGFGKSTLIVQWLDTLEDVGIGWVSLDERDNDPARFMVYLQAALAQAFGMVWEHVPYRGSDALVDVLIALLNSIAVENTTRQVIVLDDFHLIQNRFVTTLLMTFLEYMPETCHLVLISRADPPLPLGRMRGRDQLLEIRQADLCFDPSAAAAFLNQQLADPLSEAQVQTLHQRTEGWAAGLQLAALAMPDDITRRDVFLRDFAGSHRVIVDYLYDEVWQGLSDDIRAFLLATCILDRFNAALCDAVRQRDDSIAFIDQLERQNVFIVSLDDVRDWHRYHHLFADLLRAHLYRVAPEQAARYHQRASAWFLNADSSFDSISAAVAHALAASDTGRAADILEIHGESIWQSGHLDTLRGWLESMSADSLPDHPQVNVLRAWLAMTAGDYAKAHQLLSALEGRPLPDRVKGRVAAVQAFLATLEGRLKDTEAAADDALRYLDETAAHWRRTAAIALGDACSIQGRFQEAVTAYRQVLQTDPQRENPYLLLNAAFKLAGTYRQQGLLRQAYETSTRYLDIAQDAGLYHTTQAGCLLALRGDILCDWGQLQEALDQTRAALEVSQHSYHIGLLGWIYLFRLRCLLAARDFEQFDITQALFHELTGDVGLPPWLEAPLAGLQGMRWLVADDMAAARAWIIERGLDPANTIARQHLFEYVILARFLLAQGVYPAALALTERMLAGFADMGQVAFRTVIHILRALISDAQAQPEAAQSELGQALYLAEPGGYVQVFVEGGAPLRSLLVQQPVSPLKERILAAFAQQRPVQSAVFSLDEPLTERELEVLRLVADGLTNQAIADVLYISLNTVLYHTRNIYGKLGVKRRTQAVQRARELHLL